MTPDAHRTHKRIMTAAWLTGGVVAAPYVLSAFGIGGNALTQITTICGVTSATSSGLAGAINGMLAEVPGIGSTLAAGGWSSALASGGIGIGGTLLGNYIHKKYDQEGGIQWGKIIKYAALATSLLVALPSVLSGVTMGLTYLAFLAGGAAVASSVYGAASASLGLSGAAAGLSSSAGGLLPHLVTCGAAALPATGAAFLSRDKGKTQTHTTTTSWTTRIAQQQDDQMQAAPSLA